MHSYPIEFLLTQLKWSLARIDEELRNGNIEQTRHNGRIAYRLKQEFGQSFIRRTNTRPETKEARRVSARIGTYLNRKSAY